METLENPQFYQTALIVAVIIIIILVFRTPNKFEVVKVVEPNITNRDFRLFGFLSLVIGLLIYFFGPVLVESEETADSELIPLITLGPFGQVSQPRSSVEIAGIVLISFGLITVLYSFLLFGPPSKKNPQSRIISPKKINSTNKKIK